MSERVTENRFPMFTYTYPVIYADTDAGGVVYYAQYLRMFELVRCFYIEEFGITLPDLVKNDCLFVVRRAEIDYHSPGRLGDKLEIRVWIEERGYTYLIFAYEIDCLTRGDESGKPLRIAAGRTQLATCREKNGKIVPTKIPSWFMERLNQPPHSVVKKESQ